MLYVFAVEDRSTAVRGIIRHQNQLLVEWWKKTAVCFPPGGRINVGEDREYALVRELREELGLDIERPSRYLGTILSRWREDGELQEVCNHFFEIPWSDGTVQIVSPEAHRDFRWIGFESEEFFRLVPPSLRRLVPELCAGQFQTSWEVVDEDI